MEPFPLLSRRVGPMLAVAVLAVGAPLATAPVVAAPSRAPAAETTPPPAPPPSTPPPAPPPPAPPPPPPTSTPAPTPSTPPPATPRPAAPSRPTPVLRPVKATPTRKARNVPLTPPDGLRGRRIVYSKALMTVWVVGADNRVARRFPVVGRPDRPAKGTYRIYSKSPASMNAHSRVTFRWMVRFAFGFRTGASIGFHDIPRFYAGPRAGQRMHSTASLGLPIATGGCVRQSDADALFLYRWSRVGDRVVVLPG